MQALPETDLAGLAPRPGERLAYPMSVGLAEIERLLPHRPPMLFVRQVQVLAYNHYTGSACWPAGQAWAEGHFRGCAIVPGVFLLEAAAQVAGVGLMRGDPTTRARFYGRIGLLAGVRRCSFRRPVRPDETVQFELQAREIADGVAVVTGDAQVAGAAAAALEFLVAHVPVAALPCPDWAAALAAANPEVLSFGAAPQEPAHA